MNVEESKISYFIDETNKKFDELKIDMKEIRTDLRTLISFRYLLIGGAAAVSGLVSFIVSLAMFWVGKG